MTSRPIQFIFVLKRGNLISQLQNPLLSKGIHRVCPRRFGKRGLAGCALPCPNNDSVSQTRVSVTSNTVQHVSVGFSIALPDASDRVQ